jgi:hypothetical protein
MADHMAHERVVSVTAWNAVRTRENGRTGGMDA